MRKHALEQCMPKLHLVIAYSLDYILAPVINTYIHTCFLFCCFRQQHDRVPVILLLLHIRVADNNSVGTQNEKAPALCNLERELCDTVAEKIL